MRRARAGSASSTLTVFDTSASQVTGSVIAIGGAGGSAGVGSGANGAAANVSVYVASSTGGAVKAIAQQVGGNGGSGFNGANGGAGADSNLATSPGSQVVTATTTGGAVALEQTAIGGNGGLSIGGTAGAAGNASSTLVYTDSYASSLSGVASAGGGNGGDVSGQGLTAGNGGTAVAAVSLTSTVAGAPVTAGAIQSGGDGGVGTNGANGGAGADSVLVTSPTAANPAVSGSTTGALDLQQSALGGAAGGSDSGTAGVAGNGVSILVVQDNAASSLSGLSQAYGGTGGSTMTGTASAAGNATAKTNLTSYVNGAPVNAAADAYAGAGGSTGSPGQYASSGQAIAHATVSGFNAQNSTLAVAGTLSPDDAQTSPVVVTASSEVQAQEAFASHALANTGAGSYPADPSGDVTAGFAGATASPTGVVAPDAPPGSVVLGTSTIAADYVSGMSGTETVTDTATFSVLASSLTGALLYVDNFDELGFTGSGHETTVVNALTGIDTVTLTFTATAGGAADLSGTFALLDPQPSSTDSFNDVFGSFGPGGFSLNNELFSLTAPPVPEPSTWAMLLVGFGALALRLAMGRKTRA